MVAIPLAFAETALLIALTISATLLVAEPVQVYEQPSSLQASAAPFWVGVKNTLVVTWLTSVKCWGLLKPKMLDAALELELDAAEAVELELELEPHAWSVIAATPAAPPVRAVRRVTWCHLDFLDSPWAYFCSSLFSSHSSRSTTSWTRSSSASDMWCSSSS